LLLRTIAAAAVAAAWVQARPAAASPPAAGQAATGPDAVQTGSALFRERCADCHGSDAKGDRGPNLTTLWTSDAADARAFQIIRSGVPGSIMPPSQAPDPEIRAIIAYLRSISTASAGAIARGNSAAGEQMFWTTCGSCHRVGNRGGRLGPDLSRIASTLSRDALVRAIREPDAAIAAGYEGVTLVTRDGQRIRGVRKAEDAFSIQIMDTTERLRGFEKTQLRDVTHETHSLMPAFPSTRLNDAALDDLVAYLSTLGATPASAGSPR
jgi:putative heme-binding domain-containing protein